MAQYDPQRIDIIRLKSEEIIRKINGMMAMKSMPLNDDKDILRRCIDGTSTPEIEIQKIIDTYSSK